MVQSKKSPGLFANKTAKKSLTAGAKKMDKPTTQRASVRAKVAAVSKQAREEEAFLKDALSQIRSYEMREARHLAKLKKVADRRIAMAKKSPAKKGGQTKPAAAKTDAAKANATKADKAKVKRNAGTLPPSLKTKTVKVGRGTAQGTAKGVDTRRNPNSSASAGDTKRTKSTKGATASNAEVKSAGAKKGQEPDWRCKWCTLINAGDRLKCLACFKKPTIACRNAGVFESED